jgi:hypothetical protein
MWSFHLRKFHKGFGLCTHALSKVHSTSEIFFVTPKIVFSSFWARLLVYVRFCQQLKNFMELMMNTISTVCGI